MSEIDIDQLGKAIIGAASDILDRDVKEVRGFSERQVEALAKQAQLIARGIASGEITEATRDFFLDGLEDMARSFANTLRGLVLVTIEKVWNAVVSAIWKAISDATGVALSVP